MALKIIKVKEDPYDRTVSIDDSVIKKMNADFDGDILNLYRIFSRELAKEFNKNLNPRLNMHISRLNGLTDRDTTPMKDIRTIFYGYNRI